MATHDIRTHDRDSLARFLRWFSIGLGTAELVAPGALRRVIGGGDRRVIRLMGLRELAHGAGILTSPRPTGWVWSRVGGDALDLAALGLVARHGQVRTFAAIANVLPGLRRADGQVPDRRGDEQGLDDSLRPVPRAPLSPSAAPADRRR
jgi:hypothetical protein